MTLSGPGIHYSFALNQDGCAKGCGTPTFATVMLTDNGSGASAFVTVMETLNESNGTEVFAGAGAGDALEFNVVGSVAIGSLTPNFAVGTSPDSASTFGTFLHSITCATCSGGKTSNPAGPVSFTVGSATGVTTASFIANSPGGYYFASDLLGNSGNTGNVASFGPDSSTPEPGTIILTLSGLVLAGSLRKKLRSY